mgnify:FL=1
MNELPGTGNGMIEMSKGIEDEVYECDHHDIKHTGVVDYGDGTNIAFEVECLVCGAMGYRTYKVEYYETEWNE